MRGSFCARLFRIHSVLLAMDNVVVKSILDVRRCVRGTKKPLSVGFVFSEKQIRRSVTLEPSSTEHEVFEFDCRQAIF